MAKFSDEQKQFIIRAFETTSSPAQIRRLFLQEYKIFGRTREQFKQFGFTRINQNFEKKITIHRKKKSECLTKKRQKKLKKSEHL